MPKFSTITISSFSLFNLLLGTTFHFILTFSFALDNNNSLTYIWPLPTNYTSGNTTLAVNPNLYLSFPGKSAIVVDAFDRYKRLIFDHATKVYGPKRFRRHLTYYDVSVLQVIVHSQDQELQLGVDESYTLQIGRKDDLSFALSPSIEANTVYGALRALETFSQLCTFEYETKDVVIFKAPWFIEDRPRFPYRGLLIDTSRHYLPIRVIKQVIDSMSYAKLNVLHWHMIDEESFPLETPSYPNLWNGAYSKWERYTVEDAYEIVNFAKTRGIHVMPEVDVPGHAKSWVSTSQADKSVSKVSNANLDLSRIFPFELFHLGGDEVNTDCWNNTTHINQWLVKRNMTTKDAYQYFVLKAQEQAISNNRTPVNWEETFLAFPSKLDPRTVVHNWFQGGLCAETVKKGLRCIYSDQGYWYLDNLKVTWQTAYNVDPLNGIIDADQQDLVLGGEVCMWGETIDASDILQTIWPRAAAAAERLWSNREATSSIYINESVQPQLHYFRCLLNIRGIEAAPVTNYFARGPPTNPGSCYQQ